MLISSAKRQKREKRERPKYHYPLHQHSPNDLRNVYQTSPHIYPPFPNSVTFGVEYLTQKSLEDSHDPKL